MIGPCRGDDTFVAFQPMGIFRFWKRKIHFFSTDLYSPSIFLAVHPFPFQVSRFALASSSLAILSARSTIEQKY